MKKNIRPFTLQWYICLLDEISINQGVLYDDIDYLREYFNDRGNDIYECMTEIGQLEDLKGKIEKRMVKYYER